MNCVFLRAKRGIRVALGWALLVEDERALTVKDQGHTFTTGPMVQEKESGDYMKQQAVRFVI
jgi:hypothetical protein